MMIIISIKKVSKKLEGRAILFGFPSQQDADNWFEDPEYQTLSEHRKRGTKTQFITFIKTLEDSGWSYHPLIL